MGVGPPGMEGWEGKAVRGCEAVNVLMLGLCASRCVLMRGLCASRCAGLSVLRAQGCVCKSYISGLRGRIVHMCAAVVTARCGSYAGVGILGWLPHGVLVDQDSNTLGWVWCVLRVLGTR